MPQNLIKKIINIHCC